VLAALSVVAGGFVVVHFHVIRDDIGLTSTERWVLGTIALLLVLEATRRVAGWALVVLALALIFYAKYADIFPGFLNAPSESWPALARYMYLDNNALFGFPLSVTVSMIIAFIMFGRMLFAVNGDKVLTDFALAAMGKYRGGPAKVAVLASSFFGTISGSAVANVLMDGPITIPMMRKAGYKGHIAAAIEAVASTGGQIMPPVMGITAFIMAEFLGVPYGDIVLAALIPAILYYVALFTQVDLEAAKHNLKGIDRAQLPKMRSVLSLGWVFAIPIFVLIWTLMVERWQPGKSAMVAAILTVIIGYLHRGTRPTLARLLNEIRETGRIILDLVVITSIAGIIIGLLQLTGLAFNVSLLLTEAADGSLPILLGLTALVCIVLGMGMPSAIIYIVLSVIAAPALVEAGVVTMSAHLFLFYFGMLSMITPPVCLATIAAASVAGTGFWQTGWAGVRLGFIAYVVPFLIVYQPELIFEGSAGAIAVTFVKAVIGVLVLSYGVAGYMAERLGIVERALVGLAGLAILSAPIDSATGFAMIAVAAVVVAGVYWTGRRRAVQAGA
jgi:TRAP transporter 4TM/12TM fusion protein